MEARLDHVRKEMRLGFDRVMQKLEHEYLSGHHASLLIAVEMCLMHASMWGTSPPEWVVKAYTDRLWRFMSHETTSLDRAFGVEGGDDHHTSRD